MGTILDEIVETKRREVARARSGRGLAELKAAVRDVAPTRDFYGAVAAPPRRRVNLIAEIKRKSPSAGLIRADFEPVAIARASEACGAAALSVLTDETYFDGRLAFIEQVKAAVGLPVLRKDFMIDAYQIYESRAAGADAVLLIGEVLEPGTLRELLDLAHELAMSTLVEVHEVETFRGLEGFVTFPNDKRALLGINNRNLKVQRTDLATTERIAGMAAEGAVLVSESGVKTRGDVERLARTGVRALLIGETFMGAPDIAAKITEVLGPLPS